MIKLIIEADLNSEELQVLINEVTILHRDVFKKHLILQQTDVKGTKFRSGIVFPTNSEIKKEAKRIICEEWSSDESARYEEGCIDGANWMKERVIKLNKQT